jgi:hypothetical protein
MPRSPAKSITSTVASPPYTERLAGCAHAEPVAAHCRIGLVAWGPGARRRRRGPEGLRAAGGARRVTGSPFVTKELNPVLSCAKLGVSVIDALTVQSPTSAAM